MDDIILQETNQQADMLQIVSQIVQDHVGDEASVTPQTSLQDELAIDSIELVELGIRIEKTTGIILPNDALRACETVSDLANLVTQAKS